MDKGKTAKVIVTVTTLLLAGYSTISLSSPPAPETEQPNFITAQSEYHNDLWTGSPAVIWDRLQHLSSAKLMGLKQTTANPEQTAWVELALISKRDSTNMQLLATKLQSWRQQNSSHPANVLFPQEEVMQQLAATSGPDHIAVLLPLHGAQRAPGQAVRSGILRAYYSSAARSNKQIIKFYDTTHASNMTALYDKAISEGADFVIGPLTKDNVQQLSSTASIKAPILALNYMNPDASSPKHFYEFGLMPEDEIRQMATRAREAGLTHALLIAPENAWGRRLHAAFSARWEALGGSIEDTFIYSAQTDLPQGIADLLKINPEDDKKLMHENNDKTVLEQQRRQDFDVIFLFAQPQEARAIVPLLRYNYVNTTPIYAISAIYPGKTTTTKIADVSDLNGVIICDIPWSKQTSTSIDSDASPDRLYALGQDAYLLSQSMPRLNLLSNFPVYGSTGALTLSSNHQIHRRIPCKEVRDGTI